MELLTIFNLAFSSSLSVKERRSSDGILNLPFLRRFTSERSASDPAWRRTSGLLLSLIRKCSLICILYLLRKTPKRTLQITTIETDTYFSRLIPISPRPTAPGAQFTGTKRARSESRLVYCKSFCSLAQKPANKNNFVVFFSFLRVWIFVSQASKGKQI